MTLAVGAPAEAHEVRPAYLEIDQTTPTTYSVIWKRPTMGDVAIHLEPHLSNGWLEKPASDQYAAASFLIKTWKIRAAQTRPLDGQTVSIEGLENTITDVFVRVRLRSGQSLDTIVRPENPSMRIAFANGAAMSVSAFLILGIQHILTGPDHLLFVLGLLLLVRDRWMLLKTVSAFTLAHSLTLAAASFGLISLPIPLLNTLIALSILFLAPEVIRARKGGTSLTIRHPWIVAFAFGLLHGMGFASGLTSLGLQGAALAAPLVLFNIGVEIGQVAFIALVLALRRSFRLMAIEWPKPLALTPTYAIGILGAMWTIQYSALVFGIGS
jgi:hydrogenase/urease accessory protein HupE